MADNLAHNIQIESPILKYHIQPQFEQNHRIIWKLNLLIIAFMVVRICNLCDTIESVLVTRVRV